MVDSLPVVALTVSQLTKAQVDLKPGGSAVARGCCDAVVETEPIGQFGVPEARPQIGCNHAVAAVHRCNTAVLRHA